MNQPLLVEFWLFDQENYDTQLASKVCHTSEDVELTVFSASCHPEVDDNIPYNELITEALEDGESKYDIELSETSHLSIRLYTLDSKKKELERTHKLLIQELENKFTGKPTFEDFRELVNDKGFEVHIPPVIKEKEFTIEFLANELNLDEEHLTEHFFDNIELKFLFTNKDEDGDEYNVYAVSVR